MIDETGNIHGNLIVLSRGDNSGSRATWLCQCECGNETTVSGDKLRAGHTKSCGCLKRKWKLLPPGIASFRQALSSRKSTAKRRGHEWKLTEKQFRLLTSGACYYCGEEPALEGDKRHQKNETYIHNGLDRVKNERGYTIENVVPCCRTCNIAKGIMTKDIFVEWNQRVYQNSPLGQIFALGRRAYETV